MYIMHAIINLFARECVYTLYIDQIGSAAPRNLHMQEFAIIKDYLHLVYYMIWVFKVQSSACAFTRIIRTCSMSY